MRPLAGCVGVGGVHAAGLRELRGNLAAAAARPAPAGAACRRDGRCTPRRRCPAPNEAICRPVDERRASREIQRGRRVARDVPEIAAAEVTEHVTADAARESRCRDTRRRRWWRTPSDAAVLRHRRDRAARCSGRRWRCKDSCLRSSASRSCRPASRRSTSSSAPCPTSFSQSSPLPRSKLQRQGLRKP